MIKTIRREWLVWRGQRRLAQDDVFMAIQLLKRAVTVDSDTPRPWVVLSRAYSRGNEYEEALDSLKRALDIEPENPTFHLLFGKIFYDTDRYEHAQHEFETCLAKQPENQLAQNYLALTMYMRGETTGALERFASTGLANNAEFLGRFASVFEKEIMEHPEQFPEPSSQYEEITSSLIYKLYDTFRNGGRLTGKIFRFLLLRKCFHRGTKLMNYGNFQAACDIFNFVLKIAPENEDALSGIAITLLEMNKYDEAKQVLFKLLEQGHFEPFLLVYLGLCFYNTEKYHTALALFERVKTNRPEDFNANYYAGLCYLALGEKTNAVQSFEQSFRHYFVDASEQCLDKLLRRIMNTSGVSTENLKGDGLR